MGDAGDRMDRAGRYVLGLMDDDERERAERDLEIDPAFRDAMIEIAERMHVFDRLPAPDKAPQDDWRLLKERIDAMPQMRPAAVRDRPSLDEDGRETPDKPVAFGRRRTDPPGSRPVPSKPTTVGLGLHSAPSRKALMLALCLIVAFALGYVAGVTSVSRPATVASSP
jgi:anti-sigma factor RsiW